LTMDGRPRAKRIIEDPVPNKHVLANDAGLACMARAPLKKFDQEARLFPRTSSMRSSPTYGFGAPAHGWGRFKVPNVRSRCSYLGSSDTPGPGTYEKNVLVETELDTKKFKWTQSDRPHGCRRLASAPGACSAANNRCIATKKTPARSGLVAGYGPTGDAPAARYACDRLVHSSPDFSFGISKSERFPSRHTTLLSEGLAFPYGSSHLDNLPPTIKPNIDLTKREPPIISVTKKRGKSDGFWVRTTPGPDAYKHEDQHKHVQYRESTWNFGTEPKGNKKLSCLINKVSTLPHVGPGRYSHSTSLLHNESGRKW